MWRGGGGAIGAAAITAGTITGTNVGDNKIVSAVPMYVAATGTMANNGAVTLGTAMTRVFNGGLWLHLPASAISAGSSAGWYWTVMSSATVGQVFNSTYTSGVPRIGTATAFATTGPGAFTGETGSVTAMTYSLPANSLGIYGGGEGLIIWSGTNNANNKTGTINLAGTAIETLNIVNNIAARNAFEFYNIGTAAMQTVGPTNVNTYYGISGATGITQTTIDSTAAISITTTLNKTTATDNFGQELIRMTINFSNA